VWHVRAFYVPHTSTVLYDTSAIVACAYMHRAHVRMYVLHVPYICRICAVCMPYICRVCVTYMRLVCSAQARYVGGLKKGSPPRFYFWSCLFIIRQGIQQDSCVNPNPKPYTLNPYVGGGGVRQGIQRGPGSMASATRWVRLN